MTDTIDASKRVNALYRGISAIERAGNRLPHPFWLFWIMAGVIAVLSFTLSQLGVSVTLPDSSEVVEVKNLLSLDGISFAAQTAMDNFAEFPPVATPLPTAERTRLRLAHS